MFSIFLQEKKHKGESFFQLKYENNRISTLNKKISNEFSELMDLHSDSTQLLNTAIGKHCFKPSKCDYLKTCWNNVSPNIFDLIMLSFDKRVSYYKQGIISFEDIKQSDLILNKQQDIQIKSELSKKIHLDYSFFHHFLKP